MSAFEKVQRWKYSIYSYNFSKIDEQNYSIKKNCKKSKKIVKKLLTLQYLNVILYEQPREVEAKWSLKTK